MELNRVASSKRAVEGGGAERPRGWRVWASCWPGAVSGVLLWMAFPPIEWSFLACVALVPLLTLVRAPWRSRPIYRSAWVGGLLFGLLAVHWIRYADDSGLTGYNGWFALAAYLSLYFPVFLLAARIAVLRFRVPGIVAVPVIWVGLEHLRSWLITGFPWYYLGHSQYRWIELIQIADLGGAYAVSFVVALVNGWLGDVLGVPLLRRGAARPHLAVEQVWRLGLVVAVFAATLGYGAVRLNERPLEPGPRVALVQTNVPQKVKVDDTQVEWVEQHTGELLVEAVRERPQLIIWPETSFLRPFVSLAPNVTDEHLQQLHPKMEGAAVKIRAYAERIPQWLGSFARAAQVPMLVGLNWERIEMSSSRLYNTAVIVSPTGELSRPYHKVHLVPWGEYLPLRDWLPWLRILTPHASADYGLDHGSEHVRFESGGYTFGVLICFEDTLPWTAREYVRPASGEPVDFLVNISNDGWFAGSSELDVHLAISTFRAIECRRALVRAVNTGVSAIIDSTGRIVQVAGKSGQRKLVSDIVVGAVPLDERESVYANVGDWMLGLPAFGLTVLCIVLGFCAALWRHRMSAVKQ